MKPRMGTTHFLMKALPKVTTSCRSGGRIAPPLVCWRGLLCEAGLLESVHEVVKGLSIRDRPIVTDKLIVGVGTQLMQRLDASAGLLQTAKMRLGSGEDCPAGPLDVRLAQRALGRVDGLLKPS